jgi:hypothetical protein
MELLAGARLGCLLRNSGFGEVFRNYGIPVLVSAGFPDFRSVAAPLNPKNKFLTLKLKIDA